MISLQEGLLDEKLADLEKARVWSPRVISKLEALIRSQEDRPLFRINPIRFAAGKTIAEQEAIDLFLYGTKLGLFVMNWQLLCPGCGDVVESFGTLKSMDSHYHCDICQVDYQANLDEYIEVSFTISPQIRKISFHIPDALSIEDFYLKFQLNDGFFLPSGAKFADAVQPLIKILSYLQPGEKKQFEVELSEGLLVGCDRINRLELAFEIKADAPAANPRISIQLKDGKFDPAHLKLSPGKFIFEMENHLSKKGALLFFLIPPELGPTALQHEPFLSGKRLLTHQTFRDLFRSETFRGTEGIGVKDLTVLFTDLKGSTALYDTIGDLKAFALVHQHFERLGKVINEYSGAVVKTIGDAVMAVFLNPVDGMRASLEMLKEIARFNQEHGKRALILKIGLHKGAAIAVTLNERLDYFGQSINIAARVQNLADAEEIYFTRSIYDYPGVRELLKDFVVSPGTAQLKGLQQETQVYKVAGAPSLAAPAR